MKAIVTRDQWSVNRKPLHDIETHVSITQTPQQLIDELERLRNQYIQWRYPDAQPRFQRVVSIIQRK